MLLLPAVPSVEDMDVQPEECRARRMLAKRVPRLLLGDGRLEPSLPTEPLSTFSEDSSGSVLVFGDVIHRWCCLNFPSSVDIITTSDLGDGVNFNLLSVASPKYGHVQGGGRGNETEDFF